MYVEEDMKEDRGDYSHVKSEDLWFFSISGCIGVVVYAVVGVVLFRGMSEIIHRESNLYVLRFLILDFGCLTCQEEIGQISSMSFELRFHNGIHMLAQPEARGYHVYTGYVLLLTLSVLCDNDAVVSVGRAPLQKDDRSVGRVPLHRRINKRWLYWACPTQRNEVMCLQVAKSIISGLHFNISKFITLKNPAESTDIGREQRCRSALRRLSV
uniref:Uncharacterized protein n=1 Tax=Cucumis melo TaxID=3656 RepID=A0A9I9E5E3_CUCME